MADHPQQKPNQQRQQAKPEPKAEPKQQAVVEFEPPRIMYDERVLKRYGLTKRNWLTLIDAVFPTARTIEGICLALDYCLKRQLDVFARPVHIVPIYSAEKTAVARRADRGAPAVYVETVWLGIAALRIIAFRTGLYAGCSETVFGDDVDGVFEDTVEKWTGPSGSRTKTKEQVKVKVTYPAWAQITVYRKDAATGERQAYPGPRVYWLAGYGRMGQTDIPNDRWQRAPSEMLEKQAEAAALRKAFPEEIGDWQTDDELATRHAGPTIDGTATEEDITYSDKPSQAWFTDDDESGEEGSGGAESGEGSQTTAKDGAPTQAQQAATADGNPKEESLTPQQQFVNDLLASFEAAADQNALNALWKANSEHIDALEDSTAAIVQQKFDEAGYALSDKRKGKP